MKHSTFYFGHSKSILALILCVISVLFIHDETSATNVIVQRWSTLYPDCAPADRVSTLSFFLNDTCAGGLKFVCNNDGTFTFFLCPSCGTCSQLSSGPLETCNSGTITTCTQRPLAEFLEDSRSSTNDKYYVLQNKYAANTCGQAGDQPINIEAESSQCELETQTTSQYVSCNSTHKFSYKCSDTECQNCTLEFVDEFARCTAEANYFANGSCVFLPRIPAPANPPVQAPEEPPMAAPQQPPMAAAPVASPVVATPQNAPTAPPTSTGAAPKAASNPSTNGNNGNPPTSSRTTAPERAPIGSEASSFIKSPAIMALSILVLSTMVFL